MSDARPAPWQVLETPMRQPNDAGAATIGDYLVTLLDGVWRRGDEFSGKRPFGYTGWHFDVYLALVNAGFVEGVIDEENGYLDKITNDEILRADKLVAEAIKSLWKSEDER